MIRKETAIKLIECFERLGQEYDYYTDDNITNEKIGNPFNNRSEAKAFVKWIATYFHISIPSEVVLNNNSLEQLAEKLSINIEVNDFEILSKIIDYYVKCWDRVICMDFQESISDTIRYSNECLEDEIIEDMAEEIYDEVKERMQMPIRDKN